jgi:hypothetical protein
MMDENHIWEIRAFVYQHFAETTRPPRVDETALQFMLNREQAAEAYEELHRRHALFLAPGTHDIQMAWPFSGLETPFKVHANGKIYYANCAWDSLGILTALQADGEIEAKCAQSDDVIRLSVSGQQIQESDVLVHFLVPFRGWYDDLAFT